MLRNTILYSPHLTDNLYYLIDSDGHAIVVDPVDPNDVTRQLRALDLTLDLIVVTHCHWDHTAGVQALKEAYPHVKVAYPAKTAQKIELSTDVAPDYLLSKEGVIRLTPAGIDYIDKSSLGDIPTDTYLIDIFDTPGHTAGHISLYSNDLQALWCGDAIFYGGAGNCINGGDPSLLFHTFKDVFFHLPPECRIFCGHHYAPSNLRFCLVLENDNDIAKEWQSIATPFDTTQDFTLPSVQKGLLECAITTIGREKSYNPFFRFADPALQSHLQKHYATEWQAAQNGRDEVEEITFVTVRSLRNHWNGRSIEKKQ